MRGLVSEQVATLAAENESLKKRVGELELAERTRLHLELAARQKTTLEPKQKEPKSFDEAHAMYLAIKDPGDRIAFGQRHAKLLGLK